MSQSPQNLPQNLPMIRISLSKNGEFIKSYDLNEESALGRSEDCSIRINDRAVSRVHALLKPTEHGLNIERKSDFGILKFNGVELTHFILKTGDEALIGPYTLKIDSALKPSSTANLQKKDEQAELIKEILESESKKPSMDSMNAEPEDSPPLSTELGNGPGLELANPSELFGSALSLEPKMQVPSFGLEPTILDEGRTISASQLGVAPSDVPLNSEDLFAPMAHNDGLIYGNNIEEAAAGGVQPTPELAIGVFEQHSENASPPQEIAVGALEDGSPNFDLTGSFHRSILDSPNSPESYQNNSVELIEEMAQEDQKNLAPSDRPNEPISNSPSLATEIRPIANLVARLIFPPGTANVSELEIKNEKIKIGRGKSCDVILTEKSSSREHAVIIRLGGGFLLRDLGSSNGTLLNGEAIKEAELANEDVISIGNTNFRFIAFDQNFEVQAQDFLKLNPPLQSPMIGGLTPGLGGPGGASPFALPSNNNNELGLFPPQNSTLRQGVGIGHNQGASGTPGLQGIPGLGNPQTTTKQSLIEKYRNLPPTRKAIWTVIIIALVYFLFLEEDQKPRQKTPTATDKKIASIDQKGDQKVDPKKPGNEKTPESSGSSDIKSKAAFDQLSKEDRIFVKNQRDLAFNYYKNKDYDKTLFEVTKIFKLVSEFEDARDIERYAKKAKQILETEKEEQRKKEEEARSRAKLAQLIEEAKDRMKNKNYVQAKELFSEILAMDPENADVPNWRKEIENIEDNNRLARQEVEVIVEINRRGWDLYRKASVQKKSSKNFTALKTLDQILKAGVTENRLLVATKAMIRDIKTSIQQRINDALAEAKKLEDVGDLKKAFDAYQKADGIDPSRSPGESGMNRIRTTLHEKAKLFYIEAVVAESYSDYPTAKKKFQECKEVAPSDDIYFERATRKLARITKYLVETSVMP